MNEEIKAASVDSPEFRALALSLSENSYISETETDEQRDERVLQDLIAHINAWADERTNTAINQLASRAMLPVTDSQIEAMAEPFWGYADENCIHQTFDAVGFYKATLALATPVAGWVSVEYTTGANPTKTGVYACRTPHPIAPNLTEDKFLMWFDGRWAHLGSDQNYRGEVFGWIGPLPRKLPPAPVTSKQEQI